MLLAFGIILVASASLAVIVDGLRKAPEGYEDETGFHIVQEYSHAGPRAGWKLGKGKGMPLPADETGDLDVGLPNVPRRA